MITKRESICVGECLRVGLSEKETHTLALGFLAGTDLDNRIENRERVRGGR